jgi:DNA-binding NarL/FixJ family response regulator
MSVRVLVADDQAVVREGLALLLSTAPDIEVVGTAADGQQAVEQALALGADVVLMDLRMPVLSGAEATARLAAEAPGVRVLVLTTFADDDAMLPALRAGAKGYLTKDATGEALLDAVRDVAAGRTVLGPDVQRRLLQMVQGAPAPAAAPAAPGARVEPPAAGAGPAQSERPEADAPGGLTRREMDVVGLVAQGLSNRQVARTLVISEATVKTHLNHVLSKLAMDSRSELIAWAWREGLAGAADRAT